MDVKMGVCLIVGMLTGLVIAALLLRSVRKDKTEKCKYDERQMAVRGRAFKAAFITLAVYNLIYGFYGIIVEKPIVDTMMAMFIGVLLAAGVQISISIWNDAYVSLNEEPKKVILALAGAAIGNAAIGFANLANGRVIEDGMLSFRFANVLCAIFVLMILIIYGVKAAKNKREMD